MVERLQRAFERVAGDPALTDPLTDNVAQVLLNCAQNEVERLVATTKWMEEEMAWTVLDERLGYLRRYLWHVARYAAASEDPVATLKRVLTTPIYPLTAQQEVIE